jgi:hypothetical protein
LGRLRRPKTPLNTLTPGLTLIYLGAHDWIKSGLDSRRKLDCYLNLVDFSDKYYNRCTVSTWRVDLEELVKLVSRKIGIPEDQAKLAVETVVGFLKQKLPAPIAGQIDAALSNPGITQGLGGLFG